MATVGAPFQNRVDTAALDVLAASRLQQPAKSQEIRTPDPIIVSDPTLMMAEMAEELGFLKAEELGGADEAEGDQDAAFEDLISELIKKSMKAQAGKVAPEETQQQASALKDQLLKDGVNAKDQQRLNEALRQFSGGSSQKALALMDELAKLAQTDPALARLGFGQQAIVDFALSHEQGLQAALNIADALAQAPDIAQDSAQRILSLYEESISSSQSVLQTFQRLGQTEGIATLSDWRAFLTEAVAADLAKQNSGGDKIQLQLILTELKGFRTFNTLTQGLERLMKSLPKDDGHEPPRMMQATLDYIEQPLREFPNFEAWAQKLVLARKILFFQNFRNLLKSLPDDAYASAEQKAGTLIPFQKRVDDLTWSEDI
jgi:type III secretion system YopN/LcrE/InvE/MxiC family regulator